MGSKKAPPPDPAQQELARTQAQAMRDQMTFNKDVYADMKSMADRQDQLGREQFEWQRGLSNDAKARSDKYDALFDATTGKQIAAFSDQVDKYDTAAERDRIAGRAITDVQSGMGRAYSNFGRMAGLRGINPGSAAYLSSLSDMALEGGLATAAAGTMAQEAARREGLQLRATAAGLGGSLGGLASSSLGQASGMGMTSLGAAGAGMSALGGAASTYNQGQGAAINWGSSANSTFNSVWDQAYKRSQSSGGFGDFAGNVLGKGLGAWASASGANLAIGSDRRLKTDITPVGRMDNGLTVYRYRYKAGGPSMLGVMADEVAILKPEAYVKGGAGSGFDAVDYSKL